MDAFQDTMAGAVADLDALAEQFAIDFNNTYSAGGAPSFFDFTAGSAARSLSLNISIDGTQEPWTLMVRDSLGAGTARLRSPR